MTVLSLRALVLVLACLVTAKVASSTNETGVGMQMGREFGLHASDCPPCNMVFTKLETTPGGARIQNIETAERGEPKSGTSFMFHWAVNALDYACKFLNGAYGLGSCQGEGHPSMKSVSNYSLVFNPSVGVDNARCICDGVDEVRVSASKHSKHALPVTQECRWRLGKAHKDLTDGCTTAEGLPVHQYNELWECMHESWAEPGCETEDDRLQFVPIRDPRAVAVSTYFHFLKRNYTLPKPEGTLEENVMEILPGTSQRIATRYIYFQGIIPEKSTMLWYQDAIDDPFGWHNIFLDSVGLHIPPSVVDEMVVAVDKYGNRNVHLGGEEGVPTRSWRDEVKPEYLEPMDDIVRLWLPHTLLARWNIPA